MKTVIASVVLEPGSVQQFEHTANDVYSKVTFLNASPGAAEVSLVVGDQPALVRLVSVAGFAAPRLTSAGRITKGLNNLAVVSQDVKIKPGSRVSGVIANNSNQVAKFTIFLSN